LAHLHQRKFYHRDLKLENVAVSEGNIVKLIDFGSSTSVAAGTTASATADEEEGGDGGTVATERTQVISQSQKAHTRAPEVVLGESVKGTLEEQEKVRSFSRAQRLAVVHNANSLTRGMAVARCLGARYRLLWDGVWLRAVRRVAAGQGSVRQRVRPYTRHWFQWTRS
jgi:serine/threonine protein kinase